ncbi:MAG: prepilin-type N-terminal cleavage/methylation domain-containing protein [Phycisphaerales bacterium]|nr:prepilin-type N-terminal cleavage/methylation domain-containing protein [Phycisphaerales bacterium]
MARHDAQRERLRAFTLVELLVVISIIALLIAILLPSLKKARAQGKTTVCLSQLHTLGQGLAMYAMDNNDVLVPCRMPNLGDGVNWRAVIAGGLKYRPTFLAIIGGYVGVPAFDDPQPEKSTIDKSGEKGDRQNYASTVYVCPAVADWTDERNGSYGYNYQFLGNNRLLDEGDPTRFKNWPVIATRVRSPGRCVAVADSMGTAASFRFKKPYDNNGRDPDQLGNEGFNLDPPRVDPTKGEMAEYDNSPQAASTAHGRHNAGQAAVLWMDAHASGETPQALGYNVDPDGVVGFDGTNNLFHIDGKDEAWVVPD